MTPDDPGPAHPEGALSSTNGAGPRTLNGWIEILSEKGMPVFAKTVQEIAGVAADRESSAAELARVILQDPAMTARLLRMANSPMYGAIGRGISTVSRAVVVLGFDTVRSLCLSIAVIDSLESGAQRARMAEMMARSFLAATQARAFAEKRRDASPEEVFIATLLCGIGELAFWSLGTGVAGRLDEALRVPGCDRARAERELLGFELRELSLGLSRKWNLGKLLEDALERRRDADPRVINVEYAHDIARQAEKGWETPEMKQLIARVAEGLYMPLQETSDLVHQNAGKAAKAVQYFGVGDVVRLIPLPAALRKHEPGAAAARHEDRKSRFLDPDPMLQLSILRDLSAMMDGQHDINLLLETVLEGVFRGIGMDRTLFAMLNPDQTRLRARYALGWDKDDMRDKFVFEISPLKANVFGHALATREALWFGPGADPRLKSLVTQPVLAVTGGAQFFTAPIEVNGRAIGLFYADRKPSERPLDEDSFLAFKHFCQQANLALAYSRRSR